MSNDFLVIMPTYNELEALEKSVEALLRLNPEINLLIVDDNSPDGTGALADKIAGSDYRVRVIHREKKEGLGPAYLAGFNFGIEHGYKFLVEMDADGSHRPEDLPALIEASNEADLAIGSRWVPGGSVANWPFVRTAISRIGNWYARVMLNCDIQDMTAGFRIYRADFLEKLDLQNVSSHGYSFQVEMAWRSIRAQGRVVEVPITFFEREQGASKMTASIVAEALWLVTKWGIARMLKF